MTTLDSDKICSLIVWENGTATEYSQEDIDRHGLTTIYEVICDYPDEYEVTLYDIDDEEIETVTVGDIRKFVWGRGVMTYNDNDWEPMWERDDKANRDSKYRLMWSKDGLGEDEIFDDLDVLRASFRENCKTRLKTYKNDPKGYANVPVIPESMYEQYVAGSWYDYDSCCWVNLEWAADYGGLRPGAYFGDLNGYAKNIIDKGRLGRTMVKFT